MDLARSVTLPFSLFMQDTIYCFRLLAGRRKRTLLYALCTVAAVWLLNPEWPF